MTPHDDADTRLGDRAQRKECANCGWEQAHLGGSFVLTCPRCKATTWTNVDR